MLAATPTADRPDHLPCAGLPVRARRLAEPPILRTQPHGQPDIPQPHATPFAHGGAPAVRQAVPYSATQPSPSSCRSARPQQDPYQAVPCSMSEQDLGRLARLNPMMVTRHPTDAAECFSLCVGSPQVPCGSQYRSRKKVAGPRQGWNRHDEPFESGRSVTCICASVTPKRLSRAPPAAPPRARRVLPPLPGQPADP